MKWGRLLNIGTAALIASGCELSDLGAEGPPTAKLSEAALCFTGAASTTGIDPATYFTVIPIHNFSFSVWVTNPGDLALNDGVIFGLDPAVAEYFSVKWIPGTAQVQFELNSNGITDIATAQIADPKKWNQITITYDATITPDAMKLFINGLQAAVAQNAADLNPGAGTNLGFAPSGVLSNTCLDEAAFWNRTLTAEEVRSNYLSRAQSPEGTLSDFKSYWKFGESGVTSVGDSGGSANLTLSGSIATTDNAAPGDTLGGSSDVLDEGGGGDGRDGGENGNGGYGGEMGDGTGSPDDGLINP